MVLATRRRAEMQCHMLETVDDGAQLHVDDARRHAGGDHRAAREHDGGVDDRLLEALPSAAAVCAEMG